MIKAFYRKVKASDEDKHLLRVLRQAININDYQYNLGMITEDEYNSVIEDVVSKVSMLEGKYGLRDN